MTDKNNLFQKVEDGELTADKALRQLEQTQQDSKPAVITSIEQDSMQRDLRKFDRFTHWWIVPYTLGVLITALGAFWMYLGWNLGQITFGFWIAWIPFMLGVMLMALSWYARASHWLHIRINQRRGRRPERIMLSMPLPFGIIKWANRSFGHHFPPEVRGIDLDDLLDSIEASVTYDNPIYVWVDDDKDQQQVEIWIGRGSGGAA
jgi:hypothetical protein